MIVHCHDGTGLMLGLLIEGDVLDTLDGNRGVYARSCTCWYNKTNSNTNANFTNKVRILEEKKLLIPTTDPNLMTVSMLSDEIFSVNNPAVQPLPTTV